MLCVVPAKAGTHNHLSLLEQKPLATAPKHKTHGVWVPAFAGTTLREITHSRDPLLAMRHDALVSTCVIARA
jgi:hypothetical protein